MFTYFISTCLLFGVSLSQQAGDDEEYALNFDSPVYVCPDDASQEFVDTAELEVKRHNETTSFLNGIFKFLKEVESCTLLEIILEKTAGGRTEVAATHEMCDLCKETNADSNYYKYIKYIKFPDSCPFEAGGYDIVDMVIDTEDLPLNRANEARYQTTLNFYKDNACDCRGDRTFLGCTKFDFVIEPVDK